MPALVAKSKPKPRRYLRWVLDPRTSSYVTYWEMLATLALVYVALVTPVEVGFLSPPPPPRWANGLFQMNRIIDLSTTRGTQTRLRTATLPAGSNSPTVGARTLVLLQSSSST